MVIDAHCHAGAGDGFTGPWDTRAAIGSYMSRAARAGILRTVIFAAFHSDYATANLSVARAVRRWHPRLIGFAFVHPGRDRGRIGEMVSVARTQWGFAGIKVHRRDAPLTREVCEVARWWRMPVLYDPIGEVHPISLFAREYPDVAFIVPHLGSFADDWRAHETTIDLICRFSNVFTDTAGVRRFDYLREAVRRGGAQKVIFGSDGPFLHPALELAKIRLLGLSRRDEALVTGGNIARLLRRAPGAPRRAIRAGSALRQLSAHTTTHESVRVCAPTCSHTEEPPGCC